MTSRRRKKVGAIAVGVVITLVMGACAGDDAGASQGATKLANRTLTPAAAGGAETGPTETGPTETVDSGENPEPPRLVEPVRIGTVTRSGGGCALEIDAEPIPSGPGRLTLVNETKWDASFDLLSFDSVATFRRLEASAKTAERGSAETTSWTYSGFWGGPPSGAAVLRQTAVEPGASRTLIDRFATGGAYGVACVYLVGDGGHHPFALVGPIVVP
jgi:hypothetical protein